MLLTGSGSSYRLQGSCDILGSIAGGVPSHVAKYFKNGFPPQWRALLQSTALPSAKKPRPVSSSKARPVSRHKTPKSKAEKENTRSKQSTNRERRGNRKAQAKTSRKKLAKKEPARVPRKMVERDSGRKVQSQSSFYHSDPETYKATQEEEQKCEQKSILEQLDALATLAKSANAAKVKKRKSHGKSSQAKKKRNSVGKPTVPETKKQVSPLSLGYISRGLHS